MAILGIDEVGRGPWAGPLVIGAVILGDPTAEWCAGLTDSKKLTPKRRQTLSVEVLEHAAATALGWVSSRELDELGMSKSLALATRRAVREIQRQGVAFHEIIIDGTINFLASTPLEQHVSLLKKADLLIKEVSAASIIAKVARDSYMANLGELYPSYGFERHMGYGTAAHQRALQDLGPCPEHRRSFRPVKVLLPEHEHGPTTPVPAPKSTESTNSSTTESANPSSALSKNTSALDKSTTTLSKNTTTLGRKAEDIVANYLATEDHQILARNHRSKFYEIDIISIKDEHVYFTEVKYRQNSSHGDPQSTITPSKLRQMTFAAETFLEYQPHLRRFSPLLAAGAVSGSDFHLDDWFVIEN